MHDTRLMPSLLVWTPTTNNFHEPCVVCEHNYRNACYKNVQLDLVAAD